MANTTGTATNQNTMLDALATWLVANTAWVQIAYTPGANPNDNASLVLRAPGVAGANPCYLFIDTLFDVGAGKYAWRIRSGPSYDAAVDFAAQPSVSPAVYFNVWDAATDYWFYGNDRRVIVAAKCDTSYVTIYGGLFLPFAFPDEYLNPFLIMGNGGSFQAYDDANARNRMIADPGAGSAYYLDISGSEWKPIANHQASANAYDIIPVPDAVIWPHRTVSHDQSKRAWPNWNTSGLETMRPNAAGDMPAFVAHIISLADRKMVGVLDGVLAVPGFGRTSEQTITVGAETARLFQNIFRTTGRDYMGIIEG